MIKTFNQEEDNPGQREKQEKSPSKAEKAIN